MPLPLPTSIEGGRRTRRFVLFAFALATLPLLLVRFPDVMDYPNHLARIWLLAGGAKLPAMTSLYVIDWSRASTNVAFDWVAAQIGQLLPLPVLDRLLRLAMFITPAAGAALLGRSIFGRWSAWHISPLGFIWGTTMIAGFMSYSVALGLALFAAAAIHRRGALIDPATLAIHVLFSAVLLLTHPFGLLFYLALVSGLIAGATHPFPLSARRVANQGFRLLIFAGLSIMPLVVLFVAASHPPSTVGYNLGLFSSHFGAKGVFYNLLSPVLSYAVVTDTLIAVPIFGVILIAAVTGRIRVHFGLALVAAVLFVAALVAPEKIGDASWLDRRIPLMAWLTACAAILPEPRSRRGVALMAIALSFAVVGRLLWIGGIWALRDRDMADMLAVTQAIRPGDAVIVVRQSGTKHRNAPLGRYMAAGPSHGWRAVRRHLPAMLVPFRQAFIPTLFTVPGQHPLRVAPGREADSVTSSGIPGGRELLAGSLEDPYIGRWRCDFRYLLLIGADEPTTTPLSVAGLRRVASRGFAALYAIGRDPAAPRSCGPSPPPRLGDAPRTPD